MIAIDLIIAAATLLSESAHVNLNEIIVLKGAGKVEASSACWPTHVILNRTELLREGVQCI